MKKWIIAAAALLAVAAPGVASAQSGYLGVLYANTDVNGGGDGDAFGVEGAAFFPGSGALGFELDGVIVDNEDSDTGFGVKGHLLARHDSHMLGAFVGVADADDSTTWTAGVEGAMYFNRWTAFAALGYGSNDDSDTDGIGVNVGASLFATDNLRFDGQVGWASIDNGADDDALSLSVGAELQLDQMPVSLGLDYAHVEFDDANAESDTVRVVVRYNFNSGSLLDRDRSGASQANRTGIAGLVS